MIAWTWIGWDGSRWDLVGGPVRTLPGLADLLDMAEADVFVRETSQTDGQAITGHRVKARRGLLPVYIGDRTSELGWLTLERAFRRTLRPDRTGTLVALAPDGTERRIRLRVEGDGDEYDRDPSSRRYSLAPLTVVADDPWWSGPIIEAEFRNGSQPQDFYGPTGYGPPFIIGSANTTANAELSNPGDVPAWPTHIVTGPVDSWRTRLNGGVLASRDAVAAGEVLVIESAPNRKVAWLYGPDGATRATRTHLSSWGFAAVPEGATVPIEVEIVGTGSLTVLTTPRYRRAVT